MKAVVLGRDGIQIGLAKNGGDPLISRLAGGKIVEMREYQDSALCERILGPYPSSATEAGG